MRLTPKQKDMLDMIEHCGGWLILDGLAEHRTARSLEAKGLVSVNHSSMATLRTSAPPQSNGE